ncbi:MAG: GNAT family N-acetyltransferase [Myxococcota bacterium]
MHLRIRTATPGDAGVLAELHVRSAEDAYGESPSVSERFTSWSGWLMGADAHSVLIATETRSTEVLGFLRYGPARRTDVAPLEVSILHVHPQHRGRGVGTALWHALLATAPRTAFYAETVVTLRCCGFYRQHGGCGVPLGDDRIAFVFASGG